MKNPQRMQLFQPLNDLYEKVPNHLLGHELITLFILLNPKPKVLIVGQLHYYALWVNSVPERFGCLVNESLLIADDVDVTDRGQNTDLVQCVLFLFSGQVDDFDPF